MDSATTAQLEKWVRNISDQISDPAHRRVWVLEDGPARKLSGRSARSMRDIYLAALNQSIWPHRYVRNRDILALEDQLKLANARVAVIGAGGLGGTVALVAKDVAGLAGAAGQTAVVGAAAVAGEACHLVLARDGRDIGIDADLVVRDLDGGGTTRVTDAKERDLAGFTKPVAVGDRVVVERVKERDDGTSGDPEDRAHSCALEAIQRCVDGAHADSGHDRQRHGGRSGKVHRGGHGRLSGKACQHCAAPELYIAMVGQRPATAQRGTGHTPRGAEITR